MTRKHIFLLVLDTDFDEDIDDEIEDIVDEYLSCFM